MNGRARIEAAFSPAGAIRASGAAGFGVVLCYEGIYIREHWSQLTTRPWWHRHSPDLEEQLGWRRDVMAAAGQDWFVLPSFYSRQERRGLRLEVAPNGIYLTGGGLDQFIATPVVGGWAPGTGVASIHPERAPQNEDEVDALIPAPPRGRSLLREGEGDLAAALLAEFGQTHYPIRHVIGPLWSCYQLWGFEEWMSLVAQRPGLVRYACQRFLALRIREVHQAAALGAAGIWIEDCMTDMVSPAAFAELNVPFLAELTAEIRRAGMRSIYYYCGDPATRWDLLFEIGGDTLSLEESKKGFSIDIDEVVDRTRGKCVLLGNLDAITLLETGSDDELQAEVERQRRAGVRNSGRFVMGLGSPVTPGTSVERVRRFCDLAHQWGPL